MHAKELAVSWDLSSCEGVERDLQPIPAAGWAAAPARRPRARCDAQGSNRRLTSTSKYAGTRNAGRFGGDSHASFFEREATGVLSETASSFPAPRHMESDCRCRSSDRMVVGLPESSALTARALTFVWH
jgi:hypothetical protein